ncbi:MAG: LysR family substrate-binding domain-containing protein [Terracoccus sp.]
MTEPFRVQFVPGVTPDKWLRTWSARMPEQPVEVAVVEEPDQLDGLHSGVASMCFVRLPVERDGLHVIPLYLEDPVVVVAKEHAVAAFESVDVSDLADEGLLQEPETVPEWAAIADAEAIERARALAPMTARTAISVAAAGSGIVIVPLSVARLHHRKDVVHRPVTGVAQSQIGLAWRVDDDDPRIETFIGIVRGRTERSTRGGAEADPPQPGGDRTGRRSATTPSSSPRTASGGRRGGAGRPSDRKQRGGSGGRTRRKGR